MKKFTLALAALLVLAPACSSETAEDTSVETETPTVEESTTEESSEMTTIPFEEAGVDMLSGSYSTYYEDQADGYKSFEFRNLEGTCAEQGLTDFAYMYDENLKYFVVESLDGEYRDTMVGMTAVRLTLMDKVELTGGEAKCEVEYQAGNNKADVTCMMEEVEVCTAEAEITATK